MQHSGRLEAAGACANRRLTILLMQVSNLLLAAGPTHQWYKRQFADYPKERRALIPWVY